MWLIELSLILSLLEYEELGDQEAYQFRLHYKCLWLIMQVNSYQRYFKAIYNNYLKLHYYSIEQMPCDLPCVTSVVALSFKEASKPSIGYSFLPQYPFSSSCSFYDSFNLFPCFAISNARCYFKESCQIFLFQLIQVWFWTGFHSMLYSSCQAISKCCH